MRLEHVNPAGMHRNPAYSQAIIIPANARHSARCYAMADESAGWPSAAGKNHSISRSTSARRAVSS